jgi:hypothetical protein
MATTKNTVAETAKKTTKRTSTSRANSKSSNSSANEEVKASTSTESVSTQIKYKVRQTIDPNTIVPVTNGFQGLLVVKNRRTNDTFIFEEFGDVQDMTYGDLKAIRSSDRAFFENNWLLFDDPEILDALDVTKYYSKALSISGFDDLFEKEPNEIKRIIAGLSKAQRRSVAYKARNMIILNELDSLKVIDVLEESLGIKLLER